MDLQSRIESQEKMLEQFRHIHNGMTSGSRSGPPSRLGSDHGHTGRAVSAPRQPEPPLKGIIMQKEARERAQQQVYKSQRAPSVLGKSARSHVPNELVKRSHTFGPHSNITPIQTAQRPFSSHSTGSLASTPRIRDLSSRSGYVFTSSSNGGHASSHHVNKRRKPSSSGAIASVHQGMSPSTAFALNRGPHSGHGPQYLHHG